MKRRISLLLLALICMFAISGCASTESADQDVTTITEMSNSLITIFASMDEATVQAYIDAEDFDLSIIMYDSGIPADGDTFSTLMSAWQTGLTDCGDFVSYGSFEAEVKGEEVTVTASAMYSERDAVITFIFDDGRIESLTIDPVYSFNEILVKAVLNTLLGMGTVFAVLIFIAFIISLFKYIPMLEEKFKNKKSAPAEVAPVEVAPVAVVAEPSVSSDLELIAVITAAIAAAEGTTTDGFVVRSIKRRKSNKWNA